MRSRLISLFIMASLILYPIKARPAILTLTIATCAATCKYIGAALLLVGTNYLATKIYEYEGKHYYVSNPSDKNSSLMPIEGGEINIGTVTADNLKDAKELCRQLAKQRGVTLYYVISTSGGKKYKCIAAAW